MHVDLLRLFQAESKTRFTTAILMCAHTLVIKLASENLKHISKGCKKNRENFPAQLFLVIE
jgi:hypothetical protein